MVCVYELGQIDVIFYRRYSTNIGTQRVFDVSCQANGKPPSAKWVGMLDGSQAMCVDLIEKLYMGIAKSAIVTALNNGAVREHYEPEKAYDRTSFCFALVHRCH